MINVKQTKGQQGFTLIELSIVLVIIGLIVGGVLVGQDLIRAAEIRATVSQLEKYNSAVNTFRGKYNGIPGDLQCNYAFQFGFTAGQTTSACLSTGMVGTAGLGDGNGLIEASGGGANDTDATKSFDGEALIFWNQLSVANLLDGSFGGVSAALPSTTAFPPAVTSATMSQWIPPAKLGRGNYVFAFTPSAAATGGPSMGSNYYQIQGITAISTAGAVTLTNALTPIEARNIDSKLDDGLPSTGIIKASVAGVTLGLVPTPGATAGTSGDCTTGASVSAATYDVSANISGGGNPGTQQNCGITARFN